MNGISAGTTTHSADGELDAGEGHAIDGKCPQNYFFPQASTNVGNSVTLIATDCNTQPNASWSATWGNAKNLLQCSLSQPGPALPSGGTCVQNGKANGAPRNCYQVNTSTCSITYCPGSTRIVNSACTEFLDYFPVVTVTVPAGCAQ